MERLFFTNACFEDELLHPQESVFLKIPSHPIYLQLHYLSCVVREEEEHPLLMFPPDDEYRKWLEMKFSYQLCKLSLQKEVELSSWGFSASLASWANEKKWIYAIPNGDVLKKVNGKDFSYHLGKPLPKSELLFSLQEALLWYKSFAGPKVLKSFYGASGRGHLLLLGDHEEEKIAAFIQRSGPVLGEPWVERVLDFSSQWHIDKETKEAKYIGATICKNSSRGTYRGSIVGPEEELFGLYQEAWQEHQAYAKEALMNMAQMGFFGAVGFDAMVYLDPVSSQYTVQPIVEINARRTMGWVALRIFHKLKVEQKIIVEYSLHKSGKENWLPKEVLMPGNKKLTLPGELTVSF
jgi:hypothetical protein